MRFAQFFQPNQDKPIHTVKLGDEQGTVKSGATAHNQQYSRRKELELNRRHVGAYHSSSIAQSHLSGRQTTAQSGNPRTSIYVARRPSGPVRPPATGSRPNPTGHHFQEPPARNRPGY